jgi:probable DNA repair protein
MPSDWAASFSRLLGAMGWPGERALNSAEYQTTAAWKDMLAEFASLDNSTGNLPLGAALTMLERISRSRQFQPESEPAPVQILGVFEASGLEFDHLWIMGMHDGAWPRASSPNPFLPLRLQREKNMPQSSAQRELEFTRQWTEQLLSSAPQVVVSYPLREGDADLRPSPLFSALPETGEKELGLASAAGYPEQLRLSSRIEAVEDHAAPPWEGPLRRGGTAIFTHQAACPFRAFAQLRLGAEALGAALADDPSFRSLVGLALPA